MNAATFSPAVEGRAKFRVVVSHSGKQHSYRHALAVQKAGCLTRFVTSGYYRRSRFPDCLLSSHLGIDRALRRRQLDGLDDQFVTRRWRYELPEYFVRLLLGNGLFAENRVFRRDAAFDCWVSRRHATAGNVLWGFQGSCRDSLGAARQSGRLAVAEFATAHVTAAVRLLRREVERHPEWAPTISNLNFPEWYRVRLEQEPQLADLCIAASGFTARSLTEAGIPENRIRLLPLGTDVARCGPGERRKGGPFRILFVGGIGQRKGVKYLLDAYMQMRSPATELVLVGPLPADIRPLRRYRPYVTLTGRMDHVEVLHEMRLADVLVLPSVFEGFGLVIVEAMSVGLPVIASTHSAAPEIVREGRDGFVLEPDDVEGLADRLARLASKRRLAAEMGAEAALRAVDFSWDAHADRVAAILDDLATRPEVLRQSGAA